ncbi:hypothetical protein SAMN05216249_10469 [Acetitomaculum ruminis DSM 5522]|uniref:Uncharacterized protein n=1 Tax=Acetitomaculum ruminis DSM 5522 TaxID=1120918 RepID=A0A1I0WH09_9FIRM|nr:hypothetical protein [Acetitomaculum ruminis]SFA87854.1 hypothetical protein SAMN05216249_10469 [Acetitomaculum ruminis DSM 5522]
MFKEITKSEIIENIEKEILIAEKLDKNINLIQLSKMNFENKILLVMEAEKSDKYQNQNLIEIKLDPEDMTVEKEEPSKEEKELVKEEVLEEKKPEKKEEIKLPSDEEFKEKVNTIAKGIKMLQKGVKLDEIQDKLNINKKVMSKYWADLQRRILPAINKGEPIEEAVKKGTGAKPIYKAVIKKLGLDWMLVNMLEDASPTVTEEKKEAKEKEQAAAKEEKVTAKEEKVTAKEEKVTPKEEKTAVQKINVAAVEDSIKDKVIKAAKEGKSFNKIVKITKLSRVKVADILIQSGHSDKLPKTVCDIGISWSELVSLRKQGKKNYDLANELGVSLDALVGAEQTLDI